jgi:hypothetical protein
MPQVCACYISPSHRPLARNHMRSGLLKRSWYHTLEELDKYENKRPLVSLLQSGQELPSDFCFHLGDLLDRHVLRRKRGRPRTPSYATSNAERIALHVSGQVRDLVRGGMKVKDATAKVAEENNMSETTVANAYAGRRGSSRRVRRRMLKLTKPSKG